MSEIPSDLRYSEDHLWVRVSSGGNAREPAGGNAGERLVRVGITDFAQDSLGDVVNVTLPDLGQTVTPGLACGELESTKSISDLVSPVGGTVRTRNETLTSAPELVNADAYGQGWMFEVEVAPSALRGQLADLLDAETYRSLVAD